jgi:hypothetical protein
MNSHELNREARKNVEAELLRLGAASVTTRGTRKIHLPCDQLEPQPHHRAAGQK